MHTSGYLKITNQGIESSFLVCHLCLSFFVVLSTGMAGFSRGAYQVRVIAGMIERVCLSFDVRVIRWIHGTK